MKKVFTIILFSVFTLLSAQAQEAAKKQLYNEEINTMEQIDKAVAEAKVAGKYVICQVGGNWCPWCIKFADFVETDEEIAKVIAENFVYIHVNYSSKHKNPETMTRLKNPGRFGFPVLVVLNGDGDVMHIQNSAYLEEGKAYNQKAVLDFFKKWTPEAVNTLK